MARRKRTSRTGIPGLSRRSNRAYYQRRMPKAVGGDLVYRSLQAEWGSELAVQRASAINVFWDRGDWPLIRRWAAGEVHISRLVRAVRDGDYEPLRRVNVDGVLLGAVADEYLRRVEATRGPKTHRIHDTCVRAIVAHFGGERTMESITTAEVEAFLHAPRADGEPWSPRTQKLYKTVGGALWQFLIEREAEDALRQGAKPSITINPWRKARTPKAWRRRPAVLSEEEMRDLIYHPFVAGTHRAAFLALAAWAGLRQAEIIHLRTSQDVILDGPQPKVRIQSRGGEFAWQPKTERSERDVPMTPALAEIVREHIRRGYAGTRYLFRAPGQDRPIHPNTARAWALESFRAAGLRYGRGGEGLTLHSLRHSFATLLLSRGIGIAAVAELMGDTQEVVLSTYSHALPDDKERALRILEAAALGGAETDPKGAR